MNWEQALASKDRAILQLEEALSSRQRAIDQLTTLASRAAALDIEVQQRDARITSLERSLHDAQAAAAGLREAVERRDGELQALRGQQHVRERDDLKLEQLRAQLTEAFQRELTSHQRRAEDLEREVAGRAEEGEILRGLLAERDDQVKFLTSKHMVRASFVIIRMQLNLSIFCDAKELKQQLEHLRDQVILQTSQQQQHQAPIPAPGPEASVATIAEAAASLSQPLMAQVSDLQDRLLRCTTKLQDRDAKARKYKDAVRALQVWNGVEYLVV